MGKKSRNKKARQKNSPVEVKQKDRKNGGFLLLSIVLILLTGALYLRSTGFDFVNLDDNEHVYENPVIRSLEWANIKEMFTGTRMGNWIPLTQLSFAVDYKLAGLDPAYFHLTNIILHILNTLLVFWLFYLLTKRVYLSFLLSLMFSIHPLHVESVAWITERKDVLYAFFYLLALIFWYFWRQKRKTYYIVSVYICFALSLLAKSMAVSLPLILIIMDHFYFKKSWQKAILDKVLFFILALGAVYLTWQATYDSTTAYAKLNIIERLAVANYAFWFYPFKLILPFRQSAIYPYPQDINQSLPFYYYLLPLLTIGLIVFLQQIRNRKVHFGFWFYLLTILPVLQLLPLAGGSITCDRFSYLPSLGLFIILLVVYNVKEEKPLKGHNIFLVVIILFWGVLSWLRLGVWKDGITLHSDIIKKYPLLELPYINRGNLYESQGQYGLALKDYTSAIRVKPNSADAYLNRSKAHGKLEEYDKAIADLEKALELKPDFAKAYNNLGHMYSQKRDYDGALEAYNSALRLQPEMPGAWMNRGNLYRDKGEYEKALKDYDQSLDLNRNQKDVYNNRGTVKASLERFEEAISDFNSALQIDPEFPKAYYNRAVANYNLGKLPEARIDLERAKRLTGSNYEEFERVLAEAEKKLREAGN